jgi:DNA-binding response OmpR family regulator
MGATMRDVNWVEVPPDVETILLVEDEFLVRMEIHQLLREANYQVLDAGTSSEALRLAEQYAGSIDLLLTDIGLPDLLGPELAKILTRRYPKLKILYISGYPSNILHQNGVLHGKTELLRKPLQFDDLLRKVRAVLDNNIVPNNDDFEKRH